MSEVLVNPYRFPLPDPDIDLTNGTGFAITGIPNNQVGTRNTAGGEDNFLFDANSFTVSAAVKYYFEDSLIYTSSINSGTMYSMAESYDENNAFKLIRTATSLEWEITALGSTPPNGTGLGFNDSTDQPPIWQDMTGQFTIDGNRYRILEDDVVKVGHITHTMAVGDKWKIVFA